MDEHKVLERETSEGGNTRVGGGEGGRKGEGRLGQTYWDDLTPKSSHVLCSVRRLGSLQISLLLGNLGALCLFPRQVT